MSTFDLLQNLTLIMIGLVFAIGYYTKFVIRYDKIDLASRIFILCWASSGIGWAVYGCYNILTAASLPIT